MINATPRTLAAMQDRRTSCEVALDVDGKSFIIGYTSRKSEAGLNAVVSARREEIIAAVEGHVPSDYSYSVAEGFKFVGARIAFTGQTEREACNALDRLAA